MTTYVTIGKGLCSGKYLILPLLLFLWGGTVKTGTLTNGEGEGIQTPEAAAIPVSLFEGYKKTLSDVIETYRGVFSAREIEIIILTESNGVANAVSPAGEQYGVGLMQISGIALKEFNQTNGTAYLIEDLYDPFLNIEIGCWVLNYYYRAIDRPDLYKVYNAYNVGLSNHRSHYNYYQNHQYPNGNAYKSLKRLEWAIDVYDNQSWRLFSS